MKIEIDIEDVRYLKRALVDCYTCAEVLRSMTKADRAHLPYVMDRYQRNLSTLAAVGALAVMEAGRRRRRKPLRAAA